MYWLFSSVAESNDGGLKCFVSVKVNKIDLDEVQACWSSTIMKSAALWITAVVLCWPLGSAERVGSPGFKASVSVQWFRCIPLQLELAAVADEMSVTQMQKALCIVVSCFCWRNDDSMLPICVNWSMTCWSTEE